VAEKTNLEEVVKNALSILQAYEKLDAQGRATLTRAYHLAKKHIEEVRGDNAEWKKVDQLEAAETLMVNARNAVDTKPRGAMGIALLSLFLEVNTLRGQEAEQLSAQIERWYDGAVESFSRGDRRRLR
jgi:hypothetical protein